MKCLVVAQQTIIAMLYDRVLLKLKCSQNESLYKSFDKAMSLVINEDKEASKTGGTIFDSIVDELKMTCLMLYPSIEEAPGPSFSR